jgi:uncharacterized protein YcbK (DUF882 family)
MKYFTADEFARCAPPCRINDCHPESLRRLDEARAIAGVPFRINCAYRPKQWDIDRGRSGNSAHTRGRAFDIAYANGAQLRLIVIGAQTAGFGRIGIYKTFVHIDDDPTLPEAYWHG